MKTLSTILMSCVCLVVFAQDKNSTTPESSLAKGREMISVSTTSLGLDFQTRKKLKYLGISEIPSVYTDLDYTKAKRAAIRKISSVAGMNKEHAERLLEQIALEQ